MAKVIHDATHNYPRFLFHCYSRADSNSTLAASLAASKLHVPVAHVEAGLRSFNGTMPEEINRVVTDRLSDLLFTRSQRAADQLAAEGICRGVHVVGDVMYDAALLFGATSSTPLGALLPERTRPQFAVMTIHRAENTDTPERLQTIVAAAAALAKQMDVVFPVHPRTAAVIRDNKALAVHLSSLKLTQPVGYGDMLRLLAEADLVIADSGGLQKEAFFMGTPCVTVRDETEWVELVELGWNYLAPPSDADRLLAAFQSQMDVVPTPGQP